MLSFIEYLKDKSAFINESTLGGSAIQKYQKRIDLFLKKLNNGEEFETVDGDKVVIIKTPELVNYIKNGAPPRYKFTTLDGRELAFSKLKKTDEFGGGKGSGGGSSGTKTAESSQCLYLQAIWNNPNTDFNQEDLKNAYSQVFVDETLNKMLDLSDDWKTSSILSAKVLFRGLGRRQYTFHRGSDKFVKNVIEKTFKRVNDPFFPDINKWNPADIWIVDESTLSRYDFENINGLPYFNEILLKAYAARDIIGVSLKKVTNKVKISQMNYRKPLPEPKFTKSVYFKKDYFKSKDVYIFGEGGLEMQFRTFPAFQGEIIGKNAKHGKLSGDGGPKGPIGIVMAQSGAEPIPARKEVTSMIRKDRERFFDKFYEEYLYSGGKVKKEEFIANYEKKDIGYIESKYLGTLMLNNLKGREQKFLSLAFAYAKSSVKGKSCVHLKVY